MAKKVGFNADDMKVEDVGDARFNEPMAPKPRELSSEEEASKYMREKRNKARELEIEEVLADYTAKPKPIPPPVKKKKRRGCCYSFRRAMNCCIKVPLHEAVVDGESNMTLRAMQRLNKKAKTKPMVNAYDEWGRTALALAIKEEVSAALARSLALRRARTLSATRPPAVRVVAVRIRPKRVPQPSRVDRPDSRATTTTTAARARDGRTALGSGRAGPRSAWFGSYSARTSPTSSSRSRRTPTSPTRRR